MAEANIEAVVHSIKDPCCMALRPWKDEVKNTPEDIMTLEDIHAGKDMAR